MPLIKSTSDKARSANIGTEIRSGRKPDQAAAIAYRVQRDAKSKKMAKGGRVGYAPGGALPTAPFQMRAEARDIQRAGMIHSPTAGRADKLPMGVKPGSFIFPADVVSGMGQGNSMAGANGLSRMLKMGPYSSGVAKPPTSRRGFAGGGDVGADAPTVGIMASGGEFIAPPDRIADVLGGGDLNRGHDVADAMVSHVRKKTIRTLRKLPKPRKR